MSFILDALKKSETERQQQQAAEFASVPSGREQPAAPRWLWVLGALLAINLVVVAGLLLRPDRPAASAASAAPATGAAATPAGREPANTRESNDNSVADRTSFAEQVAEARRNQSVPAPAMDPAPTSNAAAVVPSIVEPRTEVSRPPGSGVATLPSLDELLLDGAIDLPPLHIDLHVYNEAPARRFVSINMHKYRENERLQEGPLVREITREGVVLEFEGQAFALLQ